MKLPILIALCVGLASAVPLPCPDGGLQAISVKKFNRELGVWETVEVVRDRSRINQIQAEQGDNLNIITGGADSIPVVGDICDGPELDLIPCDIPEIDPCDIYIPDPCVELDIPTQTKVVDPCRSLPNLDPCIVEADGFKWRCTPIRRVRTPCPTIVEPCEPLIIDPCDPIIVDPCETLVVDPCITIVDEPCEPAIILDPCVPEVRIDEPCISDFEIPCLSGFMDKLRDNVVSLRSGGGSSFATSFSSSSSSSSSASSSSSSSSSISQSWST